MTDRRQFLVSLTAAATASLLAPLALADDVDDVLAKITKARSNLKTLSASFKQRRVIGLLAAEVNSTGKLTLVQPNRLRWELHAPDAVIYWIGPEGLAMANKDGVTRAGKAAAGRFASVLGDLLVMVGGDMRQLRKRYTISVANEDGQLTISATPKDAAVAKHLNRLILIADAASLSVKIIEIHEKKGDKSVITFGPFTKNKPVPPSYMKPPKGKRRK